ncbi:MAG TPA: hypothetical protein VFP65_21020 [Anaeromyxobacteraceae bacterium]|nr:hypothetical protein [Anaeromyxobacteraceae bacterium]
MRHGPSLLALALAACALDPNDPKALRNLGEECVSCHRPGKKAADWPFTAGGTTYATPGDAASPGVGGVVVTLTDARGKVVTLRSNRSGNFWTHEQLAFPVAVVLQRDGSEQRRTVASGPCKAGTCNGCHTVPPLNGAPGRLWAPR